MRSRRKKPKGRANPRRTKPGGSEPELPGFEFRGGMRVLEKLRGEEDAVSAGDVDLGRCRRLLVHTFGGLYLGNGVGPQEAYVATKAQQDLFENFLGLRLGGRAVKRGIRKLTLMLARELVDRPNLSGWAEAADGRAHAVREVSTDAVNALRTAKVAQHILNTLASSCAPEEAYVAVRHVAKILEVTHGFRLKGPIKCEVRTVDAHRTPPDRADPEPGEPDAMYG